MRITGDDQGTYILAAVVRDPASCEPVRADLRSLLLRKQVRLHWRDEDAARRGTIAAAVASVEMTAVVVVGVPVAKAKQERARRLCLEVLLPHLSGLGVSQVWLEARTPSLNKADMAMVLALRGQRAIPGTLRVEVARPLEEAMLWLPDAVAGAVGADHDGDPRWLAVMRHRITRIDLTLR